MKIFNWVHRKFHNKDGWNVELRKKAEHDAHTLIEQVDLSDVIDSWKQGILTIGTFGYDPLKDFTQLKQIQLIANNDQELEEEEEEEEEYYDEQLSYVESCDDEEEFDRDHNPLVLHAFKHAFNTTTTTTNASHCDQNINAQESEIVFTVADADSNNLAFDEKKKGKRITLADLFSADSDEYNTSTKQPDHDDHGKVVQPEQIKKRPDEKHAKAKLSFAKKLIPRVKEDSDSHSRPIKKIHRMMTRMLKRKIHPEFEGKNQKKNSENGANEMVSLLQTQDATLYA